MREQIRSKTSDFSLPPPPPPFLFFFSLFFLFFYFLLLFLMENYFFRFRTVSIKLAVGNRSYRAHLPARLGYEYIKKIYPSEENNL